MRNDLCITAAVVLHSIAVKERLHTVDRIVRRRSMTLRVDPVSVAHEEAVEQRQQQFASRLIVSEFKESTRLLEQIEVPENRADTVFDPLRRARQLFVYGLALKADSLKACSDLLSRQRSFREDIDQTFLCPSQLLRLLAKLLFHLSVSRP